MTANRSTLLLTTLGALFCLVAMPSNVATAALWCARPIIVHEWGVQVFDAGANSRRTAFPSIPSYFHNRGPGAHRQVIPVRHMPEDTGIRALPLLHFYAPGTPIDVPIGLEVGFSQGNAFSWFPQVDLRCPADAANSAAANTARAALIRARTTQTFPRFFNPGPDPTRQLIWDRIMLSERPRQTPVAQPSSGWVQRSRDFDQALWANSGGESDRFVFYEANTRERPAISLSVGPTARTGRRHLIINNNTDHPVFDVFFVHHEAGRAYVYFTPTVPAHASAGFVAEEHRADGSAYEQATLGRLRTAIVDSQDPVPSSTYAWNRDICVMQQNPAVPLEHAEGHRLYSQEVDLLLDVWQSVFFGPGTTLVYREDTAYLDDVMPLSIHTDMFHFIRLRRLGLAVVTGVRLPSR